VPSLFGTTRAGSASTLTRRIADDAPRVGVTARRRASLGAESDRAVRRSPLRKASDAAHTFRSTRSLFGLPTRRKRSASNASSTSSVGASSSSSNGGSGIGRRGAFASGEHSSSSPSLLLSLSPSRFARSPRSSSTASSIVDNYSNAGAADSSDSSTLPPTKVCTTPTLYVGLPGGRFVETSSSMTQTLLPALKTASNDDNNNNDDDDNTKVSLLKALWFSDSTQRSSARHNRMRALIVIDQNRELRDYAPLVDAANRHSLLRLMFVSAKRLGNEWDARLVARCIGNTSRWLIDTPEITAFCQYVSVVLILKQIKQY
jgi:hypothetical protein